MFKPRNLIIFSCIAISLFCLIAFSILKRSEKEPVTVYKTTTYSPKAKVQDSNSLNTSTEAETDSATVNEDLPLLEDENENEINTEPVDFSNLLSDELGFSDDIENTEAFTDDEDYGSSPFGYGKYPSIPSDYPYTPIWTRSEKSKQHYTDGDPEEERILELMSRVRIKLWEMGEKNIKGIAYSDGLIYPNYPNTVYADIDESEDGGSVGVIGSQLSDEDMDLLMLGISPPGITVLDMSEGIEPISFLGL
jgi:hypothetical protein